MSYQIVTDATADLTPELMAGLPFVDMVPMEVQVGETSYTYGPGGNLTVDRFYEEQRQGKFATTSQINPTVYRSVFEKYLKEGRDVLYLCFSSGMSGTIQGAKLAIAELAEEYPQRRMVCVDTLCASVGEGFLVREAARKQAEGLDLEALEQWVMEHRLQICHWFTVDTFDHLRHGGRVSAAAAAMGTMLQIKPLLHVDEAGKLAVMEKPRGRRRAMESQLAHMERGWTPELGRLVVVGYGGCPKEGEQLKAEVARRYQDAEIYTVPIGPIIGAHTGPGMLALIYWGSDR